MATKTATRYRVELDSDIAAWVSRAGAEYRVELSTGGGARCSCPDFQFRRRAAGEHCKHIAMVARRLALYTTETREGNGQRGVAVLR